MLFRTLANMLLRLLVWLLLFQTILRILKRFEIFDPYNIFPVTRFLVTSLLVTRYFVTLFSNTYHAWVQDGLILAKIFFSGFMDRDGVELHKPVKKYPAIMWPNEIGQ